MMLRERETVWMLRERQYDVERETDVSINKTDSLLYC